MNMRNPWNRACGAASRSFRIRRRALPSGHEGRASSLKGDRAGTAFPPECTQELIAKAIAHREKEEQATAAMKASRRDRSFIDELEAHAIPQ